MDHDMKHGMACSVLGLGTAFLTSDIAENHGFAGADMESTLFPPRLKRRMSHVTRLALAAGERACADAGVAVADVPTIFASIISEIKITDTLCRNIAARAFPLSPTQFHNSVHNTAAGYWGMVTHNQHPAQAMAAGANTLAMGLLECCTQLHFSSDPVLLICYEEVVPQPLVMDEQVGDCAVAMVLGRAQAGETGLHIYQQCDEDAVKAMRSDTDAAWSTVEKAVSLAQAIKQNKDGSILISSTFEAWYAEVTRGE